MVSGTSTCNSCSAAFGPGCLACTNNTNCTSCAIGFDLTYNCINCTSQNYMNGSVCTPCTNIGPNCTSCTMTQCNTCDPGYAGTTCQNCASTYYLSTDGVTCLACSSANTKFDSCINATTAISCLNGFNGSNCSVCQSSYFSNDTFVTCYPCTDMSPNCIDCTNSTVCTTC